MKGNGNISSGSKVFITEVNNMSYKMRVEALDEMFLVGMMGLKSHSVGWGCRPYHSRNAALLWTLLARERRKKGLYTFEGPWHKYLNK